MTATSTSRRRKRYFTTPSNPDINHPEVDEKTVATDDSYTTARDSTQGRVFATRAEARRAIFRWINWYNTTRLHSTLKHVPPIEWEQQYQQAS